MNIDPIRLRHPRTCCFGLDHLWRIRRDQLGFYEALQRKHGDVVRLRMGSYRYWLLFHPEHAHAVLATHGKNFVRFEKTMRVLAQWNGSSLLIAEGAAWQAQRRAVLPAFGGQRVAAYAQYILDACTRTCGQWEEEISRKGSVDVDIDDAFSGMCFDMAGRALFSSDLESSLEPMKKAMAILSDIAFAETTQLLRLPDFMPGARRRSKRQAMHTLATCVGHIIQQRRAQLDNGSGDVLSCLLQDAEVSPARLQDEVTTLLIAGHETTASALTWIMYLLAANRSALERLQAELDDKLQGRLPRPEDLGQLPWLEAVIKEMLRLYPPAYSMLLRRATVDIDLGDLQLRKNDLVQIVPWVTQHDARWFDEPLQFRPERFLDGGKAIPRYAWMPFGGGGRVCLGQTFGMLEMFLSTATLISRMQPTLLRPDVKPCAKFSLRPQGGMPLRWTRRS